MSILVLGSLNMDLVVRTPRLPAPGETLTAHTFFTAPGGKGANQAVACARLGARTRLIGRLGHDVFAPALAAALTQSGVDLSGVVADPAQSSGIAVIAVDDRAQNNILIVPGANGAVGAADLARFRVAFLETRVVLLQLEIPLETVVEAARLARNAGLTVILDPAPAQPLPPELFPLVDILTPNETEAEALVGFPVHALAEAEDAVWTLRYKGARRVIIKLGEQGAYVLTGEQTYHVPPFAVTPVDTVAAGDAFNGALAVALAEGQPLAEAVRWGAAAGALATTKPGAQPAMPGRAEVMSLLLQNALASPSTSEPPSSTPEYTRPE